MKDNTMTKAELLPVIESFILDPKNTNQRRLIADRLGITENSLIVNVKRKAPILTNVNSIDAIREAFGIETKDIYRITPITQPHEHE